MPTARPGLHSGTTDKALRASRESRHPLRLMTLIRLMKVEDKKKRSTYLTEAIKQGWSLSQLEAKLFAQFERRIPVGRRLKLPGEQDKLLAQLEAWCQSGDDCTPSLPIFSFAVNFSISFPIGMIRLISARITSLR